ncbi:MAG: uroporphyrinogen decarboxylase family protein [Planctomycetaceae bacterium]
MNERQRTMAVLHYEPYDRLPIVHFGYWGETLWKWVQEGHLTEDEARGWYDGGGTDPAICKKLGFDFDYYACFHTSTGMNPGFEYKVIAEFPDGAKHVQTGEGVVVLQRPGATGIPSEIDHIFKGRKEWDEQYKHRFNFFPERVTKCHVRTNDGTLPLEAGGAEFLKADTREFLYGLHCGSLYGSIRNFIGVENSAYLVVDDEPLFDEIIATVGELCYRCTKQALESGAKFDFAHFWEDICFKNGPLISPRVFMEKVGPQYKRITQLVNSYGIDIVSLDCDGMIDALIPTWIENGVNTMFPIEVGTWNASIAPWRAQYGKELRGVGGMDKKVFARDRAAVDAEVERLRPLVALGGFIPCPDHRIPPDAQWDNVRYYCDRMHKVFG